MLPENIVWEDYLGDFLCPKGYKNRCLEDGIDLKIAVLGDLVDVWLDHPTDPIPWNEIEAYADALVFIANTTKRIVQGRKY